MSDEVQRDAGEVCKNGNFFIYNPKTYFIVQFPFNSASSLLCMSAGYYRGVVNIIIQQLNISPRWCSDWSISLIYDTNPKNEPHEAKLSFSSKSFGSSI